VLYRKTRPVVLMQWVHLDYMKSKKDITFNRILEAYEFHGISHLLLFRYNWNQEIITEFYSTLFFDKKERIFMWMTNGRRFNIKLSEFVKLLGLSSHLDIPKKLHTGQVMSTREMTPMYVQDSGFHAPKVDGILPHFAVLHRMRRRTLVLRIGDSDAIPAYEIWNIAINPLRSCGFTTYIMCMLKIVAHERFYKDVAHEPLRPTVSKAPARRQPSPPPTVAPSRVTHNGGASSSSSNSGFLKMFRDIFAMCCHTYQRIDVMEHCMDVLHHN
jgi:hypothetical protein